jgi:hypothetical protein
MELFQKKEKTARKRRTKKKKVADKIVEVVRSKQWNVWYLTIKQHNEEVVKLGGKPVRVSKLDTEKNAEGKAWTSR